ncbi:MAG: IPExxxVDY family protein [Bacteroidales bacterium]|nr:IPExxxVDY family protein [Bacteroidales bacterium]
MTPSRKYKLDSSEKPTENIFALGIITPESEIQISWKLNQTLKTSLNLSAPLSIELKKNTFSSFSCFTFNDFEDETHYLLVKNQGENGFLLKNNKHVDYIFIVKTVHDSLTPGILKNSLKSIDSLQTVVELDIMAHKNLTKLPI